MLVECCHRVKSWLLCRGIDYMLQAKLAYARALKRHSRDLKVRVDCIMRFTATCTVL